ncbi:MAG TPA: protein kinase [Bryobacteraceae bacterium]|nr:protein kinase [Bryobacteraceae bacterium]
MTPERFRQIEEAYHAARAKTGPERAALLAETDPELRRAVESLLAQADGGEFLDRPALDNVKISWDSTATILTAGACLGPYRIEGKLGAGGMGEVFRALDTRLGRAVAVKVSREKFSDRFEREAQAIAALNHPHICTLHDIGPSYLVMELIEGETLAQRLKRGKLSMEASLQYGQQIAGALAAAHARGIIHRDLKPGNIMLAESGVKVLDFGLAKTAADETLTTSREIMGTPAYMAPEQQEGKPADARTDIYSLGCVLHEMATGARVSSGRRVPSRGLEKIVNRCLEEDPERRWQSVAELARALSALGRPASNWKGIATAAGLAVLVLAAGGYFYLHRTQKLTDEDTIVLADFVNNTSDSVFDGTLRQALAIQLEQSPFLKIMGDDQAQRVLRLMSLPSGARITNETAREICVREGAAATIDGAIASLGKNYVISLQAVACQDGVTLARQQVQAEDKEHVLNALGNAATAMRRKLGESLASIQKLNRPLEEATTGSLEALQNYSAGTSKLGVGQGLAAIPLFERATKIDPNFADAYFRLGVAFEQAGDMARSEEYAKKAFSLSDRVSDYERAEITAYYYRATGEVDKEIDAWQSAARNYPREWSFHNQLSLINVDLGRYEEGLKEALETARLPQNNDAPYRRQLDAYICLDRLAEAKQVAEKVRRQGLDGPRIHQRFLEMAYVEDDPAAIAREIQWFRGKPEEYLSLGLQAAYLNVHGQRQESHRLYQRAAEMARRRGLPSVAAEFEEANARADALAGNCQTARRLGRPAQALAICGNEAQAEKLAAEASKLSPNGTIRNEVQQPVIQAAAALYRGQPARSVELLASAAAYERSYLEPVYLRGLAYLRLHKGAEAAAEFEKIADHKGESWGATWVHPNWGLFYSLSYLGMARGSALAGDAEKAKKAYQQFFELWKDADQDVPVFLQAKAEYAKLP